MAIVFDYWAYLQNSAQLTQGSYPVNTSEPIASATADVFFWCVFNPGHIGTSTIIEFYLEALWTVTATPGELTYTWQIKPSGGAWSTLGDAGNTAVRAITLTGTYTETGVETTGMLMPCEVQCIGTEAGADEWTMSTGTGDYICAMRAFGSV